MGNLLAACALSIPGIGWFLMAAMLCFVPFVILIKSSQRIVDLTMLGAFALCYLLAQALGWALVKTFFPEIWGISAVPVLPVCLYFLHKSDQREFGRAKPRTKSTPPTGPRQLPSHWE